MTTLKDLAKANNWTIKSDDFYCSCGEKISSFILPIANRQFGICEKCKNKAISRNLNSDEWYKQSVSPSLLELLGL